MSCSAPRAPASSDSRICWSSANRTRPAVRRAGRLSCSTRKLRCASSSRRAARVVGDVGRGRGRTDDVVDGDRFGDGPSGMGARHRTCAESRPDGAVATGRRHCTGSAVGRRRRWRGDGRPDRRARHAARSTSERQECGVATPANDRRRCRATAGDANADVRPARAAHRRADRAASRAARAVSPGAEPHRATSARPAGRSRRGRRAGHARCDLTGCPRSRGRRYRWPGAPAGFRAVGIWTRGGPTSTVRPIRPREIAPPRPVLRPYRSTMPR